MKKLLAILLSLVLLCSCAAFAEGLDGLAAQFESEFDFEKDADMAYVSSFEEAAALYDGEVPAFTAPEGFELLEILVDDFGLTAYYSAGVADEADEDAEEVSFEFSMYDYGKEEGVSHFSLADGKLGEAAASMVSLYEEDGVIYSADVHTVKGDIYFYFNAMDRAQVEAVLAGLAI